VAARLKKGLKPITFRLLAVEAIDNPLLRSRFEAKLAALKAVRPPEECKVRWAFHGLCSFDLWVPI
jgi:hypothetical protein